MKILSGSAIKSLQVVQGSVSTGSSGNRPASQDITIAPVKVDKTEISFNGFYGNGVYNGQAYLLNETTVRITGWGDTNTSSGTVINVKCEVIEYA